MCWLFDGQILLHSMIILDGLEGECPSDQHTSQQKGSVDKGQK